MSHKATTRRELLAELLAAGILTNAAGAHGAEPSRVGAESAGALPICIFSKHFQWTDCSETAALAADIGFDGVDLTVRAGGHVLPERVEQDLPKAVETIRKTGLSVPMITSGILDTSSPHAEAVLRTASGLGIRYYRWGGFRYSYDRDLIEQLEQIKPRVKALAQLNEKCKITAMYHIHSGSGQVGASMWDLWYLLRDVDPRWTGVNYDVGHATAEGGVSAWVNAAYLLQKYMRGVALKDFKWGKNARGEWVPQWCPPGEGMVDFPRFFQMLKAAQFSGPVQLHFEYPGLGGADNGATTLAIPKAQLVATMRRDLSYVKNLMKQAQLL
jgi:sugar phosphate isomerase/epimerase